MTREIKFRGKDILTDKWVYTYCRFILARHLRLQGLGLEKIGNSLNKDHATVSYYDRKYDENYRFNPEFRELADWFNIVKEEM